MKLPHEETPNEQEQGGDTPKKWPDNQDLLLLLKVTERTLRTWRKKGYLPDGKQMNYAPQQELQETVCST